MEKIGNNPTGNNVWIGDQFTPIIDAYLTLEKSTGKYFAAGVSIDDINCIFTTGHGAAINDTVCIVEGVRFFQAVIKNVVVDAITLDTPFDFAFTVDADVRIGSKNLNVDGSSVTKTAKICPPPDATWDITRLIIHMEDSTIMDSAKFGGGPALTNGIVFRHKNNVINNIFNVKTNGEFGERAYDIEYDPKAPSGVFGFRCRRSFGGQDKNGVVIRVCGRLNDEVQLIIRDNLALQNLVRFNVQGHLTTSQGGL